MYLIIMMFVIGIFLAYENISLSTLFFGMLFAPVTIGIIIGRCLIKSNLIPDDKKDNK